MELMDEIKDDADKVFNDSEKMKEVVKDSGLVIELLKQKDVFDLTVEVEGKEVILVRPLES